MYQKVILEAPDESSAWTASAFPEDWDSRDNGAYLLASVKGTERLV
jgi:hypothetical protein